MSHDISEEEVIAAAHPLKTGRHDLYAEAMRLVGARHAKGDLVDLVTWLLYERANLLSTNAAKPCIADNCKDDNAGEYALCPTHLHVLVDALKTKSVSAEASDHEIDEEKHGREVDQLGGVVGETLHVVVQDGSPPLGRRRLNVAGEVERDGIPVRSDVAHTPSIEGDHGTRKKNLPKPAEATPQLRCDSSTTVCDDEHTTFNCALDAGHHGDHCSGDGTCQWTDGDTMFDATERDFRDIRRDDSSPDAERLRAIASYVRMWADGDDAWHSIGHIASLFPSKPAAATQLPNVTVSHGEVEDELCFEWWFGDDEKITVYAQPTTVLRYGADPPTPKIAVDWLREATAKAKPVRERATGTDQETTACSCHVTASGTVAATFYCPVHGVDLRERLVLYKGVSELIEHHVATAGEEQDRIDAMPVTKPLRERLIGKVKVRRLIAGKLEKLLLEARPEKMILTDDAWIGGDDKPLPEDDEIKAAFPTRSGRHAEYGDAMRMVGARFSKGGLVALVTWLLVQRNDAQKNAKMLAAVADRMRAHEKKLDAVVRAAFKVRESIAVNGGSMKDMNCLEMEAALDALKEGA